MTRLRLTIRARLTLLYTGLFVLCGTAAVVITFLLVASLPGIEDGTIQMEYPQDFLNQCREAVVSPDARPELRFKCDQAFREGIEAGAKNQRAATLRDLLSYSVPALALVTVVAAVAGWLLAGRVLRPIHQIAAAARAASERDLSTRVALGGPRDELRELADTFDEMLERLQAAFDSQRQFIANASHELRTPLAVMRTSVDVVLAKPAATVGDLRGMGHDVRISVGHAERVIDALLTLARNDRGMTATEPVDLATVAEDVADATDAAGRVLHLSLDPAPVVGDPVLLERLTANLVDNAVRYNEPGGEVWVHTAMADGTSTLRVDNTGPVVDDRAVDTLFEPFQRLRPRTSDGGYGLGLAIVASIAAAHRGSATARARRGGGLSVTVTLPAG